MQTDKEHKDINHRVDKLNKDRLDPAHPESIDPANTDPANEAEDAESTTQDTDLQPACNDIDPASGI